jgi:hypothetical protein
MARGKGNAMVWERDGYTLFGTANCHLFRFRERPAIEATPLVLGDGSTLAPGDRVTYFGGRRTCAGYTRLHLASGHLEYLGLRQELADGRDHCAVLFRWSECDDPLLLYGAFLMPGTPTTFVYTTQHVAGRIIETTTVRRAPLDQPDFLAHRHPVMAVPCPACGAAAGTWCKRPSGHSGPFVGFHKPRQDAADAEWLRQGSRPIFSTPDGWSYEPAILFAPGTRVEAQRRGPAGIRWEPCEVVTAESRVYRVRFADGAELPRPPASLRAA